MSPVGYTVQLATNLLFIIQYVVELSLVIFFLSDNDLQLERVLY